MKIIYFNKREREKRIRNVISGQKLIKNHPLLMNKEEEIRILVMTHKIKRQKSERKCVI